METQEQPLDPQIIIVEDNESILTMTESSVAGFPNVVAQISMDGDDEAFIQHAAVDVLAMNDESDDSDTDLMMNEGVSTDHPQEEPAPFVVIPDDMPETGERMDHPVEVHEEHRPEEEALESQDELPHERHVDELQPTELEGYPDQQQQDEKQEYFEEQQEYLEEQQQDDQHLAEQQPDDEEQEYLEEQQQGELPAYPEERQPHEHHEYLEEQQQNELPVYLEEQQQIDQHEYPEDQLSDEQKEYPGDQLSDEQEGYPEDQLSDEQEEYPGEQLSDEQNEYPENQQPDEQEEYLEDQQQNEQQEFPKDQQPDEQHRYLEEQPPVERHQYLEEQQQDYAEEELQDPPEEYLPGQRQDPPEEYLSDHEDEQDDQFEYSEDLQDDHPLDDNYYSGVYAEEAAIPRHVISQDSDDDDSEAFRRDIQEPKVLLDFGVVHSSHENDAASNADNSIFADSYNGIREQLDTSLLTEAKSATPENYDDVNMSETDDFDEFLEGDAPLHDMATTKAGNFFPYPDNILIPVVATSSHAPTKDSTSSPPPPEPFLTPRRINILVATLCFVLVASVGVAVGSFLAQQAGKTTPQASSVNANENSTTVAPSSSPSTSPTGLFNWSEGDCEDHPYKTFNVNERFGDQDCVFLQSHPAQRDRLCLPENEGYRWCPVTCGVCEGTDPNNPPIAPVPASPVVPPTNERTTSPTAGTAEPTISSTEEPSAPLVDTLAPTRAIIQPTASPTTAAATPEPTAVADDVRSVIMAALTHSTVDLDDMNTPAGKAFDWVSRNSADLPSWRMPQQFAVAGLAYSVGVDAWLGSVNECSWSGITCDSNGRVQDILLRDVGLQGNLFPELYMLSDGLMTFNAGQNSMRGTIPGELGVLRNLQVLQLDRNNFSGPIPAALGRLKNLKVLNLEENSLTGTLPSTMEDMPLIHFRFYSNGLTGSVFGSWCFRDDMNLEADCDEIDCPCCSACF